MNPVRPGDVLDEEPDEVGTVVVSRSMGAYILTDSWAWCDCGRGRRCHKCTTGWDQLARPVRLAWVSEEEEASACPFCEIISGHSPATIVKRWIDAIAIVPLNPVTPGHVLVIPTSHVTNAMDRPEVTARTMLRVCELATEPCNIITSAGAKATQTVFHLHIHIVPRRANDGISLPWTNQRNGE